MSKKSKKNRKCKNTAQAMQYLGVTYPRTIDVARALARNYALNGDGRCTSRIVVSKMRELGYAPKRKKAHWAGTIFSAKNWTKLSAQDKYKNTTVNERTNPWWKLNDYVEALKANEMSLPFEMAA